MDMNPISSINTNINKVEYKKLSELLEHYSIAPEKIMKQYDKFIIYAKENIYCFKKIKDRRRSTLMALNLCHYLIKGGFNNILGLIKTKDDNEFLKYNKSFYYLSHWIEGREGSYSNFNDIKGIALLLANFHLRSQGYYNKHIQTAYKDYNWSAKLEKYNKIFSIIKEIIRNKKIKTMFDILYMDSIEFFEEQLELSVKLLTQSNYNRILHNSQLKYTLCINNFNLKNIIVENEEEYYFASLDNVKYDINIIDLSKFIKKVLFKKEYSWDFKCVRDIIDNYCIINPLSKDEITILLSLIIFPKAFYKLGKKRYIKKKKWEEDKYLTKLYMVTRYLDKQKNFVDEYIQYYSINNFKDSSLGSE
ncbi:MAG: CotS family spore coat protein [Clostridiales bacterium]|jgi:CotS family spore coat protein|nr:CotS family spore coat protein [Clostridiales bacterium]